MNLSSAIFISIVPKTAISANPILIKSFTSTFQTLKQWCDELDLNYKLTHSRIHRLHWDIEKAFEIKGVK